MLFTLSPNLQLVKGDFSANGFVVIDNLLRESELLSLVHLAGKLESLQLVSGTTIWPWVWRFASNKTEGALVAEDQSRKERIQGLVDRNYSRDPNADISIHYSYYSIRPCEQKAPERSEFDQNNHALCMRSQMTTAEKPCDLCDFGRFLLSADFRAFIQSNLEIKILSDQRLSYAMTKYTKDSFISPHTDQSDSPRYLLTFILYLNQYWDPNWGGTLDVASKDGTWHKIEPVANRLVLFKPNEHTFHRVNRTTEFSPKARYAISGWFLGPDKSLS